MGEKPKEGPKGGAKGPEKGAKGPGGAETEEERNEGAKGAQGNP